MQYIQYLQPVELLNNNVEGLVIEWNHTSILWLLCVCVTQLCSIWFSGICMSLTTHYRVERQGTVFEGDGTELANTLWPNGDVYCAFCSIIRNNQKHMLPILSLTLHSRQYNCHSLQIILSAGCSYQNFAAMLAAAEYVFQPLTVADFSWLNSRERWS